MKVELNSKVLLNNEFPQKDTAQFSQNSGGSNARENAMSANKDKLDSFSHSNDKEELGLYERHKYSGKAVVYEQKSQLEELLRVLEESKVQLVELDKATTEYRDSLIAKIEQMLAQELEEHKRVETAFVEENKRIAEESKSRAEYYAKEAKKMKACLQVAAKIRAGTASDEEKRFLLRASPTMYSLAMVRHQPNKEYKKNRTTVKFEVDEDMDPTAKMVLDGSVISNKYI